MFARGTCEPKMWKKVQVLFESRTERLQVAMFLIKNGLSVRGSKVYINQIEVPILKVARAIGIDRRTVKETIRTISADEELKTIFSKMESAGPSLRGVAKHLKLGVVEILADDPSMTGILAGAAAVLATHGISVRQAIVDDPELNPDAKLTLIGDREIPGDAIPALLGIHGVARVSVY